MAAVSSSLAAGEIEVHLELVASDTLTSLVLPLLLPSLSGVVSVSSPSLFLFLLRPPVSAFLFFLPPLSPFASSFCLGVLLTLGCAGYGCNTKPCIARVIVLTIFESSECIMVGDR